MLPAPVISRASQRRSERGGAKLKAFIWLAVIVSGVFVAIKTVPAMIAEYQLSDKISEQARFAVVNRYTEEQVRDIVFKEIQDLDIPAKREDIKVVVTPALVKISVDYKVPVDLIFYSTEMHFTPASENKSIT